MKLNPLFRITTYYHITNKKPMTKNNYYAGVKLIGDNFLHNHPLIEARLDLDANHVIVDRLDWERIIRFFEDNPKYVELIK